MRERWLRRRHDGRCTATRRGYYHFDLERQTPYLMGLGVPSEQDCSRDDRRKRKWKWNISYLQSLDITRPWECIPGLCMSVHTCSCGHVQGAPVTGPINAASGDIHDSHLSVQRNISTVVDSLSKEKSLLDIYIFLLWFGLGITPPAKDVEFWSSWLPTC